MVFSLVPESALAQVWISSGFQPAPAGPNGQQNLTGYCNTSAVNPATGQTSPTAGDYEGFVASCDVTTSTTPAQTITFPQCPYWGWGSYNGLPGDYGNPQGECSYTFPVQPGVTYTINAQHYVKLYAEFATYTGECSAIPSFMAYWCFDDPEGYVITRLFHFVTANTTSSSITQQVNGSPTTSYYPYYPWFAPDDMQGQYSTFIENPVEGVASSSAQWPTCADVVKGSVTYVLGGTALSLSGDATNISATFTPNFGFTLAQAAKICGFVEFDWQQTITSLPLPSPFFAAGSNVPLSAPPSFNDPPPQGYEYQVQQGTPNAVELPVYWNLFTSGNLSLPYYETDTTLSFYDSPQDPCLAGANPSLVATYCGGNTAPAGSKLAFTTHLVGIQGDLPGAAVIDTGQGFSWTDTFNGTSGGIPALNNPNPVDPGSGSGGITVTASSETTNYQSGTSTPPILLYGNQISTTGSGLAYSRVSKLFVGTLTITNESENTITGPFQIVLDSLQSNVTLANATGSFGGWPYLTVPNVTNLEPGQSATVAVRFSNPTNEILNVVPMVYSGSFD